MLFGFFTAIYKTQKLAAKRIIELIPLNSVEILISPLINTEKPKTPIILKILEPTIFHKATLPSFLTNAATVTDNSGREVPIAAKLIPTTDSGIL